MSWPNLRLSLSVQTLNQAWCRALDLGRSEAEQAGPAVSHRSPLTWTARLHVAADAASALAYVHQVCVLLRLKQHKSKTDRTALCAQAGWVHADCSSGNVMLTLTNDAQLCDFGLSRRAESPDSGSPTARVQRRAGELATNYAYAAPELHLPQGVLICAAFDGRGLCAGALLGGTSESAAGCDRAASQPARAPSCALTRVRAQAS